MTLEGKYYWFYFYFDFTMKKGVDDLYTKNKKKKKNALLICLIYSSFWVFEAKNPKIQIYQQIIPQYSISHPFSLQYFLTM